MGKRNYKPEDIITKLRQVDVMQSQGITIADAIRQIGVTSVTYYRWRKEYGGNVGRSTKTSQRTLSFPLKPEP